MSVHASGSNEYSRVSGVGAPEISVVSAVGRPENTAALGTAARVNHNVQVHLGPPRAVNDIVLYEATSKSSLGGAYREIGDRGKDLTTALMNRVERIVRENLEPGMTNNDTFRCQIDFTNRVARYVFRDANGEQRAPVGIISLRDADIRRILTADMRVLDALVMGEVDRIVEDINTNIEEFFSEVRPNTSAYGGSLTARAPQFGEKGALGGVGGAPNHFGVYSRGIEKKFDRSLKGGVKQHLAPYKDEDDMTPEKQAQAIEKMAAYRRYHKGLCLELDAKIKEITDNLPRVPVGLRKEWQEQKASLESRRASLEHVNFGALDMYIVFKEDQAARVHTGSTAKQEVEMSKDRRIEADAMTTKVEQHLHDQMHLNQKRKFGLIPVNQDLSEAQRQFAASVGALVLLEKGDHAQYIVYCTQHKIDPQNNLGIEQGLMLYAMENITASADNDAINSVNRRAQEWIPEIAAPRLTAIASETRSMREEMGNATDHEILLSKAKEAGVS